MKNSLIRYLLTAVLWAAAMGAVCAQEYSYMGQLSVDEGLPHTDVSSIVQDEDGYIWIGTYSGLCRYDGYSLSSWDMSNSILRSSRIRSLLLDGKLLYIGTENGGLTIYDTQADSFLKTLSIPGNCVNSIFPASDGTDVWACTNDGISLIHNDEDGYDTSSWSFGSVCLTGCVLDEDELLVGTAAGMGLFNTQDGFRVIRRGIFATDICPVSDDRMLITSYEGCYIFETATETFSMLNGFDSRCVFSDDADGDVVIGTERDGILRYDRNLNCTDVLTPWNADSHSTDIELSTLFLDSSKVLWIGTNGSGCFRSTETNRAFKLWLPFAENGRNQLVAMHADSHDRLWVSSRDGDVAVLDGGTPSNLNKSSLAPYFASMPVSAIYEDSNGDVWLGSWDHGVAVLDASQVDAACRGQAFRLKRPAGLPQGLSVYKFAEDEFGSLWITTASGVWRSPLGYLTNDSKSKTSDWECLRYQRKDASSLSDDFTTDLLVDGRTVWVGTRASLNRIMCGDDGRIVRTDRVYVRSDDSAGEFVSVIHKASDDSLWVSVLGLGLAKLTSDPLADSLEFRIYNKTSCPDFPNNEIESILEDSDGNFWMGGFGLIRFNPASGKIRCFTREDGLQSNAFKIWDSAALNDGRMAFGGINGFNLFSPKDIKDNPVLPQVRLTSLEINGKAADVLNGVPLRKTSSLRLQHGMNSLMFHFSAMHYAQPEGNDYRYMMKGLDEDWHYAGGLNPYASYLNLRPGNYTFVVYASNSDGLWSEVPASVDVLILPPWYASIPAKLGYVLLAVGMAVVVALYLKRRNALIHKKELEDKLKEEQRERNENELKFHTDFLHEIRTPLTLITTPVEELMRNPNLGKTTLSRLQLVDQSAKILQKHIESITDLRKFDNGEVRLHVVQTDFSRFVEEICLLFQPLAKARGYEFLISTPELREKLYIDKDSIEKVILNLMSNAMKYSPESGGKIDVKVCEAEESGVEGLGAGALLTVSNLGIGILPEDLPYVFDRFRQGRNNDRGGMGIGLSISRSAVLSHAGKIWAESVPGGITSFYVYLPYGSGQFRQDEIDLNYENSDHISNYDPLTEFVPSRFAGTGGVEREHLVLIVDDSQELRSYLVQLLSSRYNVITAKDGEEGYEKSISEQPDLVLTDVVMPKVNGLELCRRIKENNVTSHIPVILVSARDLPVYKMEGYQMLADDYITKPFHAELLLSRIENLIRQRECMRQSFRTEVSLEPSAVTATPVDEKFIRSCIDDIEEHISEPEYGVDELCQNIGYSRPQLYRKLKSITGLSAIQFLRSIRLKRAAQLLSSGAGMTVSQVMEAVGFSNISYFSKIFFSEFGVLPKDYNSQKNKDL